MRKLIFTIFCTLTIYTINAQRRKDYQAFTEADWDYIKENLESNKDVIGTPYLFNEFNKKGIITNTDGQSYSINNINIDLSKNNFISLVDKNNLYVFTTVNKLFIENYLYIKKQGQIYKVLYKGNELSLFAHFQKKLNPKKIEPRTYAVQRKAEWVIKKKYFIQKQQSDNLKPLKPNKKNILSLIQKKETPALKKFIKTNKLSYKNEKDLVKIIKYIDSMNN